jgi:hypothetical protein
VETSYEDPPHTSPPSHSSRSPRPGEGQAASSPGGVTLQAAAREDGGPSLALSTAAISSSSGGAVESATSSAAAVPGEDLGASTRAEADSSILSPPATLSPAPAPSTPVPGGDPAAQAAGPGVLVDDVDAIETETVQAPPPKRITRAKLAERQAAARRRKETDEEKAARKAGHHPSWEGAREKFAADLRDIISDASIDSVSEWCESIRKPTPSHRNPGDRAQLLKALKEGRANAQYLAWADELVDVQP